MNYANRAEGQGRLLMVGDPKDSEVPFERSLGWRTLAIVAAVYVACVSLATWPRVLWFRSALPMLTDPLQHLWVMRWYKACLLEGQSFLLCPEIQYPTGAPLGSFSPLYLQSILYAALSSVITNDVACYNAIWFSGIVFTGLGTFVLVRVTCGDSWCAGFGGMLAMMGGPMMVHSMGHLELIYLGGFPLFLWAWLRFVDDPGPGKLAQAAGLYIILALISAYYVVYAIFPATLYVLWKIEWARLRSVWSWIWRNGPWLGGFAAVVVPSLLVVFGNQLWARAHGYVFPRPLSEFREFGAPVWSYVLPTRWHWLGQFLPSQLYDPPHLAGNVHECCSYLGMVSLALLLYAALFRVRFGRTAFWWSTLALLVVLSGGASWTFGGREIPLPAIWLKKHLFLFQQIRVPARFNLFASVIAAVVAANGLHHLLKRIPRRTIRALVFAGIAGTALADLAMVPFSTSSIPAMPGCYAFMKRTAPAAAFVEIPQFCSGGSNLSSVCGYWQSLHRGRTNVGYCGQGNVLFDNLLTWNSPFYAPRLADPEFLADTNRITLDVTGEVDFCDYAWLYMTVHNYRFAVLHQWSTALEPLPFRFDRLKAAMAVAKVYEDRDTLVYDRERLPRPSRPMLLTTQGWRRGRWENSRTVHDVNREAHLLLYNPDPGRELQIRFDAKAFQQARSVVLLAGETELAHWTATVGTYQPAVTRPLSFSSGFTELALKSDGESVPKVWMGTSLIGDWSPYSLKIRQMGAEAVTALSDHRGAATDIKSR